MSHIAHIWQDWCTRVMCLIHTCDVTHVYVWHDFFICATWLIHMCDMTHSYVWLDSFLRVAWSPGRTKNVPMQLGRNSFRRIFGQTKYLAPNMPQQPLAFRPFWALLKGLLGYMHLALMARWIVHTCVTHVWVTHTRVRHACVAHKYVTHTCVTLICVWTNESCHTYEWHIFVTQLVHLPCILYMRVTWPMHVCTCS